MNTVKALIAVAAAVFAGSFAAVGPERPTSAHTRVALAQHATLSGVGAEPLQARPAPVRSRGRRSSAHDAWGFVGVRISNDVLRFERNTVEVVRIDGVLEGTPAAAAGFVPGDSVVAVDGRRVYDSEELQRFVRMAGAGQPLRFAVVRDGEPLVIIATTASWQDHHGRR